MNKTKKPDDVLFVVCCELGNGIGLQWEVADFWKLPYVSEYRHVALDYKKAIMKKAMTELPSIWMSEKKFKIFKFAAI